MNSSTAAFTRFLSDGVYKALVFDVVVAADLRESGLGRRVIETVLAETAGVRHVELYCKPELIPFYEQWGFSKPEPDVNFLRLLPRR